MSTDITVVRVLDWPIGVTGFPDDERRILDVELAKKLGFSRPRDIRKTIERFAEAGELPGVYTRDAVARVARKNRGTVEIASTEYWLTMEEALFITAKSETETANEILKAVIKVFLAAREAHEHEARGNVGYITKLLLADNTCEWDLMWPSEFVSAVCRLHGEVWEGGSQPMSLGRTYEKIYRALLGDAVYTALKEKNPDPAHGSNHHQWLNPVVRDKLRREIPKITMLAKQVGSKVEFWERFEHEYLGGSLQLSFLLTGKRGDA